MDSVQSGTRRPRMLVLGTSSRRSTTTPVAIAGDTLSTGAPMTLWDETMKRIQLQHPARLEITVTALPKHLLLELVPKVSARLTADSLISIEDRYPSLMAMTAPTWSQLCCTLSMQLPVVPPQDTTPWRVYYRQLLKLHELHIEGLGSRIRENYEERRALVHSSKLIGPRRNVSVLGGRTTTKTEPFASVSASSSLMKKAKTEVARHLRTSSQSVTKMFPPRKR
jgi:hypothetical protein